MISLRLVRLIETEAAAFSDSLRQKLHTSQSAQGLGKVPERELHDRCLEIYSNLGDWLLHKSSIDVKNRFQDIGVLRARQNVPLGDVIWGLFLTKEHLWAFLERQGFLLGAVELHGELELCACSITFSIALLTTRRLATTMAENPRFLPLRMPGKRSAGKRPELLLEC